MELRTISHHEGNRLLRIVRAATLARWQPGDVRQMVLQATHEEQGSIIRRYMAWRNRHADDLRLREMVNWANLA